MHISHIKVRQNVCISRRPKPHGPIYIFCTFEVDAVDVAFVVATVGIEFAPLGVVFSVVCAEGFICDERDNLCNLELFSNVNNIYGGYCDCRCFI